jgi:hypothetical protein
MHKFDLRLTRICVASIRYWYPDIEIILYKDESFGAFDTAEIERYWNVGVLQTTQKMIGWGFGHLDLLLLERDHRFLSIDVDIAFIGRVLDVLEKYDEDLIVDHEDHPADPAPAFSAVYFDLERLRLFDPAFVFPGFAFNAGQFVASTGKFKRSDFDGLIEWGSPRRPLRPEIFNMGDQGVFNYRTMSLLASGRLSLARVPFMWWGPERISQVDVSKVTVDSPYPVLIHWAGLRRPRLCDMPGAEILLKFEDFYYSRIPFGRILRPARIMFGRIANLFRRVRGRLTRSVARQYLT